MSTVDQKKKHPYKMTIERTILDDLGVKLYDKVAAVVAELIANSYDADAEKVVVELPLGKALAVHEKDKVTQKNHQIKIIDDGHGMTPDEANEFFLKVGKHKRESQGNLSRKKKRPFMGRKGLGKLSPFGVCKTIEVRSAGGRKTSQGYEVTHFKLDYDSILAEVGKEESGDYHPTPLKDDGAFDKKTGTTITLKNFLPKKVGDKETFGRQISYRFGLGTKDFKIIIKDNKENPDNEFEISKIDIPVMSGTKIDLATRPVETENGEKLKVSGWIAMAKQSYKNEEFAGVRIYVRGKIAAITRDFGLPSGFQGEYVARSYLVGEVHADWLDDKEDLIQTHRQDILWSSELGRALGEWGRNLIKEVAKLGREPRRQKVSHRFIEVSKLQAVAKKRYNDPDLEKVVISMGEKIGGFASEDELEDEDYVAGLTELILTVAPHKLLVDTFKEIESLAVDGKVELTKLIELFRKTQIAQMASLGQVALEKIKVLDLLESTLAKDGVEERDLQEILEKAPWVIDSSWEPLTMNENLETFRKAFERWYKKEFDVEIATTIDHKTKRPDFILIHMDNAMWVVEIKATEHKFDSKDWIRFIKYVEAGKKFLEDQPAFKENFRDGFKFLIIADGFELDTTQRLALKNLIENEKILVTKTWEILLRDTKKANQSFIKARKDLQL